MKHIGTGDVIDVDIDPRDQEIEALRSENRRLQRAVSDAEVDAKRAREDADRALSNLRRQLGPLYRALQMVFGELDAAGVADTQPASSASTNDGAKAKWDEWKQRLDNNCARVIDALLLGGEMNVKAIMVACRMGEATVYRSTSQMGQAGILVKNGGKFSLKQL